MTRRSAEERRAYREFVRAHHPDRGGDPTVFAEGLARFRAPRPDSTVTFHHRRRGLGVLLDWFLDARRRRRRPPRVR